MFSVQILRGGVGRGLERRKAEEGEAPLEWVLHIPFFVDA